MGTPFDTYYPAAHTAHAAGNQRPLIGHGAFRAMAAEGFMNYDQEWWHFTFTLPDELVLRSARLVTVAGIHPLAQHCPSLRSRSRPSLAQRS